MCTLSSVTSLIADDSVWRHRVQVPGLQRQCQRVAMVTTSAFALIWRYWVAVRLIEPETRKWRRPKVDEHMLYLRSSRPPVASPTVMSEITRLWTSTGSPHKLFCTRNQRSTIRRVTVRWPLFIIIIISSWNSSIITVTQVEQSPHGIGVPTCVIHWTWRHRQRHHHQQQHRHRQVELWRCDSVPKGVEQRQIVSDIVYVESTPRSTCYENAPVITWPVTSHLDHYLCTDCPSSIYCAELSAISNTWNIFSTITFTSHAPASATYSKL